MTFSIDRRRTLAAAAAAALLPGELFGAEPAPLTRIAFGSCARQDKPQPIWKPILAYAPELFVFLGDNVYADTTDMALMQQAYDRLAAKPGFRKLRAQCPTIAIWDDHDYGADDAGSEYPAKADSKRLFLRFWQEPEGSPRWTREGNYTSYVYGPEGKRVQIILPDLRWFRSWLHDSGTWPPDRGPYLPNPDPGATMLGEAQWQWLESELRRPAEIRILGMSTQLLADFPGYEAWANFPRERQRLFDLIRDTEARGVIVISGDTHYAELSRLADASVPYPLIDLTSSGLTEVWTFLAPNRNRIGRGFLRENFGTISIDWAADPQITLEVRGTSGRTLIRHQIALSELQPRR